MSKVTEYIQRSQLRWAAETARRSPDRSSKNGAVLICQRPNFRGVPACELTPICACNDYVDLVMEGSAEDRDRQMNRDRKMAFTEHAERAVLFQAAKLGYDTRGSVMFCPWASCVDCARAIVGFGVSELIRLPASAFDGHPERWRASIALADEVLRAGGVTITEYAVKLGMTYFVDGKEWNV